MISGITSSSIATAGAYIADVTPPEGRAKRFGMLGAAFGFGFILGPAVGGLLGSIDLRLPFWVAGGLSLANAVYGLLVLPESLPPERRAPFVWRRANPVGAIALLRTQKLLAGLAVAAFLARVAHDSLPSTFVLYATYRYGWDERALFLGLGAGAAGFVIYTVAATGLVFLVGIPIMGLYGLANPALQALMSRRVGGTEQGQLQGAGASLMGIAGVVAPALFTFTFAAAVGPFRTLGFPGAPFFLAALLLVAAIAVSGRASR